MVRAWWRTLRQKWFGVRRPGAPRPTRLEVEALEGRQLLTTHVFLVNGAWDLVLRTGA